MELSNGVVIRGGGDLASGIIHRLHQEGYHLLVLETKHPSSIRRGVSFSEAVYDGEKCIEGSHAIRIKHLDDARDAWNNNCIPVLSDADGICLQRFRPIALIDAILAKRNCGSHRMMSDLTIGVGPGFTAGSDVHTVIETARGSNLGRIITKGSASANSGIPAAVRGYTLERVVYAHRSGQLSIEKDIGCSVNRGERIAAIDATPVTAPIKGIVRGMIRDRYVVPKGMKIIDIDPRIDQPDTCITISDKARRIGNSVLEVLSSSIKK